YCNIHTAPSAPFSSPLHDALPICDRGGAQLHGRRNRRGHRDRRGRPRHRKARPSHDQEAGQRGRTAQVPGVGRCMRILIVDDHPVMRGGIRMALQGFDTATETIEAADLEEAVQAAKAQGPFDLVLLDLKLPAVSGVETLLAFRKAVDPCPPVVVFSATDDRATVIAALDAGAMGFIPKTSTPAVLQSALRLVLAKGIYVPPT